MKCVRNMLIGLFAFMLVTGTCAQTAENTSEAPQPLFITTVLEKSTIQFYDLNYQVVGQMRKKDFEELFVEKHPDPAIGTKVLPIKAFNRLRGLFEVTITDDEGTRDVWVSRSSVEFWPTPSVCSRSVRGELSQSETLGIVGAGGC